MKILVVLLILVMAETVTAQTQNKLYKLYDLLEKSPTQATLYATVCPGLGHLYTNSNYGGWYAFTATCFYTGAVFFKKDNLRKSSLFSGVLTHIISIVDARASAERYNLKLHQRLSFQMEINTNQFGVRATW